MTDALRHRGPDGEGFMTASGNDVIPFYHDPQFQYRNSSLPYTPLKHISESGVAAIAFGHRRLNIIDLSEGGHQPMCDADKKTWINFNGEIYNYIELREELEALGFAFMSACDTEVVLNSYKAWGNACVDRFNGMWSFCIYDSEKKLCFASRDRLGVKPFYYINTPEKFAFASEQKAFVAARLITVHADPAAVKDYLLNNLVENSEDNFFEGVRELWPGHSLVLSITTGEIKISPYYKLHNHINNSNDHLTETELTERISQALENAVRLRLRSDVEVGTCLSGGIDSSALAVIINKLNNHPPDCFTSVFPGQPFDEGKYAAMVASMIKAPQFKTEPTLDGFLSEADDLIYSQDVPIWDTSTYAQYKVMELAHRQGIKVVLDGQGADELFAGYHHHFIASWNNLLKRGRFAEAFKGLTTTGKSISNPISFYMREKVKAIVDPHRVQLGHFFRHDFMATYKKRKFLDDVNEQLADDIYNTRLKSFLKCEDRCGMWHSVESRTPFSDDVHLINLLFSFNGNKKIKNGVSKYLLREAVKDLLPQEIYRRFDKKGFETPMQDWMRAMRPTLISEINAMNFSFLKKGAVEKTDPHNQFQNKMLFRLFVLSRWHKLFTA